MKEVKRRQEDEELSDDKDRKRSVDSLGHMAIMPGHWLPKSMLLDWLLQSHPRGCPRKRW